MHTTALQSYSTGFVGCKHVLILRSTFFLLDTSKQIKEGSLPRVYVAMPMPGAISNREANGDGLKDKKEDKGSHTRLK